MTSALALRDDYVREVVSLREQLELLTEENRQLKEAFMPSLVFPFAWRLTPQETRFLAALYAAKGMLGKEGLHIAISSGLEIDTDEKLVDVLAHKTRRKIEKFGLTIKTCWGAGYVLAPASRQLIARALAGEEIGAVAPPAAPTAAELVRRLRAAADQNSTTRGDDRQ